MIQAEKIMMLKSSIFVTLLICTLASAASKSKDLIELNEENWRTALKGEWMIEFYAPW